MDLIRAGEPMTYFGATEPSDYRILVSRRHQRPRADLVPFGVRETIPSFPVPLAKGEKEPEVPLGSLLHDLYERAAYDLSIDYRVEPVPPLAKRDRAWAHQLLARAGRR